VDAFSRCLSSGGTTAAAGAPAGRATEEEPSPGDEEAEAAPGLPTVLCAMGNGLEVEGGCSGCASLT